MSEPLRLHATLRKTKYADEYIDIQLRVNATTFAVLNLKLGTDYLVLMLPEGQPEPAMEAAEPEPQRV